MVFDGRHGATAAIIRQQIASPIDLIVHQSRLRDGSRKVVQASEVVGMEGDTIVMQDVFRFEQTGIDENGKILGELLPTGLRPLAHQRPHRGCRHPPAAQRLRPERGHGVVQDGIGEQLWRAQERKGYVEGG